MVLNHERDSSMPRVHHVKAAKDYLQEGIKKGEMYFWAKPGRRGRKIRYKNRPRPSQLTGSAFLTDAYGLREEMEDASPGTREDLQSMAEDWKTRAEELRDQCQESLDNMPEHLQDTSETGQILTERIDNLDNFANEIDGIDFETVDDVEDDDDEGKTREETDEDAVNRLTEEMPDLEV